MNLFRSSLGALLVVGIALGGCKKEDSDQPESTGKEKISLAFVTNGPANFWTIATAGVNAAAKDFDCNTDVRLPNGLVDQNRVLEDLLARNVDGIAVSPIDGENQNGKINEAAGRTHLITHDSDAPGSDRLMYIGMDNYTAGRMCGELVKEAMPDGGEVIIFIGRLEQANAKLRRQGTIDELLGRDFDPTNYDSPNARLEGNGFVILDTRTDDFTQAGSQSQAEDALARYPEIDGMIGLFAYNPPAILNALRGADKLDQVTVIGFDEDEDTLEGIKDGHIFGTIVQNPYMYGYESIRILAALAREDMSVIPEDGFLDIPARKIVKANVDDFHAELRKLMGED